MSRLRICQLITELQPAGAERIVYELARRLDPARFQVEVAGLRGGAVVDWLKEANIPVTVIGFKSKHDLGALSRLTGFLRHGRFDLLHTHLFHADLAGRLAARRAGIAHLVHTIQIAEARFRPWQFAFARWMAGRCDRIICASHGVMDHHSRKARLSPEHYQVIYNGIDLDTYVFRPDHRVFLRRQWGVADDVPVLLFLGRLNYQKNVELFLHAAEALRNERPILAVIAGDGPERKLVEKFLLTKGHDTWCHWLGHVEDVPAVLSACDVLVQPSRWEGFCLAAAEAMAVGIPVVATNVAGLSEVVEDGVSGLLAKEGDLASLLERVRRVLNNPALRESLRQAGRERVATKFNIQQNVTEHERLYEEVCGKQ
jgi:glycosyltransferase involved in cell wall biosynthesis